MRSLSRFALATSLPLVLLTGIAYAHPTLVTGFVPGWWDESAAGPSLRDEKRREDELVRRDEVVVRRVAAKRRIIDEVVAGRLTLLEAAAWFRHLNNCDGPRPQAEALWGPQGRTEGERMCRQVLSWVRSDLQACPESQYRAVYGRLEAELEAELARSHGTIELPQGGR
jgi:hypothetical protein